MKPIFPILFLILSACGKEAPKAPPPAPSPEGRLEALEKRLSGLEKRLSETIEQQQKDAARVSAQEQALADLKAALEARPDLSSRLDGLEGKLAGLEGRLAELALRATAQKPRQSSPKPNRPPPRSRPLSLPPFSLEAVDVFGNAPVAVIRTGEGLRDLGIGETYAGWQVIDADGKKARFQTPDGRTATLEAEWEGD